MEKIIKEKLYVPLSEIVDEVKMLYNSYFESGMDIDETTFLPKVRYVLRRLGLPIHSVSSTIIDIEDYKGPLPNNFHRVKLALGSFQWEEYVDNSMNPMNPIETREVKTCYKIDSCEVNSCTNECGEYINIIQQISDGYYMKYNQVIPLSVHEETIQHKNISNIYDLISFKAAKEQIRIIDNEINTTFCEGKVYLEYYKSLVSEDGSYLIPDNEYIRNLISLQIQIVLMEYVLINTGINTFNNMYQMKVMEYKEALRDTELLLKTPEFKDFATIGNRQKRMYNTFNPTILNIQKR